MIPNRAPAHDRRATPYRRRSLAQPIKQCPSVPCPVHQIVMAMLCRLGVPPHGPPVTEVWPRLETGLIESAPRGGKSSPFFPLSNPPGPPRRSALRLPSRPAESMTRRNAARWRLSPEYPVLVNKYPATPGVGGPAAVEYPALRPPPARAQRIPHRRPMGPPRARRARPWLASQPSGYRDRGTWKRARVQREPDTPATPARFPPFKAAPRAVAHAQRGWPATRVRNLPRWRAVVKVDIDQQLGGLENAVYAPTFCTGTAPARPGIPGHGHLEAAGPTPPKTHRVDHRVSQFSLSPAPSNGDLHPRRRVS